MRVLVTLPLFFCALAVVRGKDSDSSSAEENIKDIAQAINEKFNTTILLDLIALSEKVKEKCPDMEDKMEETMDKVGECLEDIQLGSETFCTLIKTNFVKCSKPVRELVTTCLPEESKGIPSLVEKLIVAIINQACSSTVEEVLELFNPCMTEKEPDDLPVCKEIITTVQEYKNKLPSKAMLCETIPKVKNCLKAVTDATCPNAITKEAHSKMQEAIDKAVKEECDAANAV